MSSELEEHITKKYEIKKRLGKGVSYDRNNVIKVVLRVTIRFATSH